MDAIESKESGDGARRCERCGAAFVCDLAAGKARCWCFDLPAVMPVKEGTSCLCPACLKQAIDRAMHPAPQAPKE